METRETRESRKFGKESFAFNKNAIKMGFEALSAINGQAAVASDFLMAVTPAIPEEGKKVVNVFFKESQKVLDSLKNNVERSLDIDWTAKNAPVKNLEMMESFCKDAFVHVDEIKRETKTLVEKATKPLPREAKSLLDTWNESMENGYEFFQTCVFKNLEMARKAMADAAFFAPSMEPKGEES